MGKKVLIVVDYQYDFANPNGALYVTGGEHLFDRIMKIIPNFDGVIFTQDWHPIEHCSFILNGGTWPVHCVSNSIGAGIPVEMFTAAKDYGIYVKGEMYDMEEYGAFDTSKESLSLGETVNALFDDEYSISRDDINEIVICGIAGDYCVLETLKNVVDQFDKDKVSVYLDGIVSIDGGKAINDYIADNKIAVYVG